MFEQNAQQLLAALKLPAIGEMTSAELPKLIQQLKAAAIVDKTHNPIVWPEENNPDVDPDAPATIHFSQRVAPVLQLMERCLAATESIRWPA